LSSGTQNQNILDFSIPPKLMGNIFFLDSIGNSTTPNTLGGCCSGKPQSYLVTRCGSQIITITLPNSPAHRIEVCKLDIGIAGFQDFRVCSLIYRVGIDWDLFDVNFKDFTEPLKLFLDHSGRNVPT
jgi:hypothetical protein